LGEPISYIDINQRIMQGGGILLVLIYHVRENRRF
jgi:hypothetical protein